MESNRITVLSEHQFTVVYDTTQFVFGHKCTCLFIIVFVKYEPNQASLSFILATGPMYLLLWKDDLSCIFVYNKLMWKFPSSIRWQDLNAQPLGRESLNFWLDQGTHDPYPFYYIYFTLICTF